MTSAVPVPPPLPLDTAGAASRTLRLLEIADQIAGRAYRVPGHLVADAVMGVAEECRRARRVDLDP